jgi:hypothetical protein
MNERTNERTKYQSQSEDHLVDGMDFTIHGKDIGLYDRCIVENYDDGSSIITTLLILLLLLFLLVLDDGNVE